MTPDKETIRPCPFCGKEQQVEHWARDGDIVDPPCIGDYFSKDEWQNAYCWKELDSLRAENEKLKQYLCGEHEYSACPDCVKEFRKETEAYKLRIRELEEAVEATDDYFRACAKQWADHEGRVVSPNANVIEGSEEVERLCELAGRKVVQALSKTKPSEGEKEKP